MRSIFPYAALLVISLTAILAGCTRDHGIIRPWPDGYQNIELYVDAHEYLRNRFFRLDLPAGETVCAHPDVPGRDPEREFIDPVSVIVFRRVDGPPETGDLPNVAAFRDTTGRWPDFSTLDTPAEVGALWRPVPFGAFFDRDGRLEAVDLLKQHGEDDVLAVIYDVIDPRADTRALAYEVGDDPGMDEDQRIDLFGDGNLYYRMKLLKPARIAADPYCWQYARRNIYSLGGANIDFDSFDLTMQLKDDSLANPEQDASGLDWIRIFDLDGAHGSVPDGRVDKTDPLLFNLQMGLMQFPAHLPEPFNASREQYEANVDSPAFVWEDSWLSSHLIPEIYDPQVPCSSYAEYSTFRFFITYRDY
jgi:hypothetical protein